MTTRHLRSALWAVVGCSVMLACGKDPTTSTQTSTHPASHTGDQDQSPGGDAAIDTTHALAVHKTGQGTGTVTGGGISCGTSCSTSVADGTVVSLSATPTAGSTFAGFSGCDSATATTCTVTMNSDRNITAAFGLAETTLTVARSGTGDGTVTGGGISCGATCSTQTARNSTVTLTASPGACTELESWSGCDSTSGPTCTVTMGTDRTVTAKLTRVACTLTVQANGTGSGLVTGGGIDCGSTCSASVPYGTVVTLAATPGACSSFNAWDGCDSIAGDSCTVTMDDDRTVDPTFTRFPVICNAGETRCVAGNIEAVQACDAYFNYSGGWNTVYASIVGDGYGNAVDLLDLNWILLEVR